MFSGDSNFWCVRGFNHMQCDCTCACAVACLHSHNSISNVVVSLIIHDDISKEKMYTNICLYIEICERIRKCICKCIVCSFVLSGPDIWRTKPGNRNVRGNPPILTSKSSSMLGERGERQTEPCHNWFPPQCPSRELELNNFIK